MLRKALRFLHFAQLGEASSPPPSQIAGAGCAHLDEYVFPLLELPVEIIFTIFGFLSSCDLLVLRATGCPLLHAIADDPSLWRSLYARHLRRHSAHLSSTVALPCYGPGVGMEPASSSCGSVDRAEVKRFGWRRLAITLMKVRCFQCGAQPSFVVFLDNTRKCQKCINTEKLRREVEETKRWEREMNEQQQQLRTTTEECESETRGGREERRAKRAKVAAGDLQPLLLTAEKRRAVKVSRRLTRLGALLGEAGKHADAEALLQEVLKRDIDLHGVDSLVIANDYHNLAHLCKLRSNTFVYVRDEKIKICKRGMEYIAESLRVYERYLGGPMRRMVQEDEGNDLMLRVGDCLCLLAGYLCTTSTHLTAAHKLEAEQNALKFLDKATVVYQKLGDERGLAEAYRISAGIFADTQQDKDKAIDYLRRSLVLVDKIFGRESIQAADIMQKFGYMYWNWDRESVEGLERSLDWHQKELLTRSKVMGPTHPITKRAREDVFIILERLGRQDEAHDLYAGVPPDEPTWSS